MKLIEYIGVVGFHHQLGNRLEWTYPSLDDNNNIDKKRYDWDILPFSAIPDGVHNSSEDYTFFILNEVDPISSPSHRLYGIAHFKQVHTKDLPSHSLSSSDTRSSIQKSIFILSNFPIFYTFSTQLRVATHCFFSQGDFTKYDMLINWFDTKNQSFQDTCKEQLNNRLLQQIVKDSMDERQRDSSSTSLSSPSSTTTSSSTSSSTVLLPTEQQAMERDRIPIQPSLFFTGEEGSVKKLVNHFGRSTLVLFKLLMLERGVVEFCPQPVNAVCDSIISLVSLFPRSFEQFLSLNPAVNQSFYMDRSNEVNRHDLDSYLFPLNLFSKSILQPYLSLHQISSLSSNGSSSSSSSTNQQQQQPQQTTTNNQKSYLVGTSNNLFLKSPPSTTQVIIDIPSGDILYRDESLYKVLELSSSDRRFIDNILTTLEQQTNNNTNNNNNNYIGSDKWIRDQFELYLLCLLSHMASLLKIEDGRTVITQLNTLAPYNEWWIRRWSSTRNFGLWKTQLFRQNPCPPPSKYPIHPSGPPSDILDSVQDKLTTSMKDLQPITTGISKALFGASTFLFNSGQSLINRVLDDTPNQANQPQPKQTSPTQQQQQPVREDYLVENEIEEIVKEGWTRVQENSILAAKKTAQAVKPLYSSGKVLAKQLSSQLINYIAPLNEQQQSPRNNNNNNEHISSQQENSTNNNDVVTKSEILIDTISTTTTSKKDNISSQVQLDLLEEIDENDIYEL
ncbi:hypothetical protein DFA_02275 [Cavenderia fasciculata]|uniref:UDENN domain-containing protein n=1 Tax=Cavenderia fasciculata TaxID=261658 RepID=F4PZ03_CACFS|nr:uncharacterized protein DFA_02275 [Cavenderia fasciculata]EGG19032.1 hypothetical protein DFA_02275 [Cavenderia fasciculata]|eukprot:XP_004366665.1 hypothetical protein DFA_02275 [Cavenderia fasciculata]